MEEKEKTIVVESEKVEPINLEQVKVSTANKKGNFGWALLGFFIPIAGFVLFLVWRNDRPGDSKMAGLGALVSVILDIVMTIIYSAVLLPIILEWIEKILA